jgi:hypothetical protein
MPWREEPVKARVFRLDGPRRGRYAGASDSNKKAVAQPCATAPLEGGSTPRDDCAWRIADLVGRPPLDGLFIDQPADPT